MKPPREAALWALAKIKILRPSFRWLALGLALTGGFGVGAADLLSTRDSAVPEPTGANGDSVVPILTPDGRFVVFSSLASDLVTNDNGWLSLDVFRRDRQENLTVLVSENRFHTGGAAGHSAGVGVSAAGRYVLLESVANDLVAGDSNELGDVFVRDCQLGATHLVSVATNGLAGAGLSELAVMTPDGRYVAFVSYATNLVAGDTNGIPDVFVRDLQLQTTTLVSVGASNTTASMGRPAISTDGRWVAFFSTARNLVPGVSNVSRGEIYLRDTVNNTTLWPSRDAINLVRANMQFTSAPVPLHPVLSADGRYVTFASGWTNNAAAPPGGTTFGTVVMQFDAQLLTTTVIDTNGYPPAPYQDEVYGPEATPDGRFVVYSARSSTGLSTNCTLRCWDRLGATTTGVSVDLVGGIMTNSASVAPALSADGRLITFLSNATNLVGNSISNGMHLYRRDMIVNTTELVDANIFGFGGAVDLSAEVPVLTADGRFVAFAASDGDFVASDDNGADDVFLRDAVSGTLELVSVRASGLVTRAGNAAAVPGAVALSGDGHRVVYASLAADLISVDTNLNSDVFVWDRNGGSNQLVSVGLDGYPSTGGASFSPLISADGRYVFFASSGTNLVELATNKLFHIYRRDLELQLTSCLSITTNGVSLGSVEGPVVVATADAQRLVFIARTNSTTTTYSLIWRDLGTGETRLVSGSANYSRLLSLSTNGQRVAYQNSSGNLFVWDVVGNSNVYAPAGIIGSALISPGGNRLLSQTGSLLSCYDFNARSNLATWSSTASIKSLMPWSPDERYVVLVSAAPLVEADTNGVNDVYLCDLQTGTRSLISATPAGTAAGAASDAPMFSADGRFIAYRSEATNLLAAPTVAPGLFVFDRATGSNRLVIAKSGIPGTGWFSAPVINADGTTVAFKSVDSGLDPGDFNRTIDAFAGQITVLSLADGDGDGIPDWWLQQYFGHANGQANDLSRPGDDADGDGVTNHEEFLTGTNPMEAASVLAVQLTLTPPTGTNAVLSWPALAGKSYRVQFSDDVAAGNWQNLTTAVQVAGGQGWVTVNRTNSTRVFRVRCEE